jgi:hypothetical protein
VGELVTWADGVEVAPAPHHHEVREVVLEDTGWSSSTWISSDGAAYQRTFDPFADIWRWSGPKSATEDARGALCVSVGTSVHRRTLCVARAVALAWIDLPDASSTTWHAAKVFEGPLCAETIGWIVPGSQPSGRAEAHAPADVRTDPDDEWTTLCYAWFSLAGELEQRFDPTVHGAYEVSRRGWLRSPYTGATTRGVRSPLCGRRWASLVELGHVWLDEAVRRSFGSDPPRAHVVVRAEDDGREPCAFPFEWGAPRSAHRRALDDVRALVEAGRDASSVCTTLRISRSTLWTRLHHAARTSPASDLPWLVRFVPSAVRAVATDGLRAGETLSAIRVRVVGDARVGSTMRDMPRSDCFALVRLAMELALRHQWLRRHDENMSLQ